MSDRNDFSITTERLLLESVSMRWKEDIFREFDDIVTTFMFPRPAKTIDETEEFITSSIEKMRRAEEIGCVILTKDGKEFLGCGGLHDINTKTPQLGVWIKKSAHGNKYGLEAMTALKIWADKHLTYTHIVYPVDRDNIASRKIPEALGGIIHSEYEKINLSGRILHTVEYHIPHHRP